MVNEKGESSQQNQRTPNCSTDFVKVIKYLIEKGILENHVAVKKDIYSCISNLKETSPRNSFDGESSAVYHSKDKTEKRAVDSYGNFIYCISQAIINVSSYKEIVEDSLEEIIKLTNSHGETCHSLFQNIVEHVDISSEKLETAIMKSVEQMDEILELSNFNNIKNQTVNSYNILEEFTAWLVTINRVLDLTNKRKKVLENQKISRYFVKFYLKLFKMLQSNTIIEAEQDLWKLIQVLQTLELSTHVFRSQKVFVVKRFLRYWPFSYQFQEEVINTFMNICENFVLEEQNELEVLVEGKLNELLMNSNYVKHNYELFFNRYKNYFSNCYIYS